MIRHLFSVMLVCGLIAIPAVLQAATTIFDLSGMAGAGLLPGNSTHAVTNGGTGGEIGGGIWYDSATMVLTVDAGWGSGNGFTDLSGDAGAAHIHGPADINNPAGMLIPLTINDASAASGFISGTVNVTAANEVHLLAGNTYLNVHTAENPGGEIRGNLFVVPEPASFALLAVSLLGTLVLTRRKRV